VNKMSIAFVTHAGVLTLASVSWYAAGVVQEFYQETITNASFTYEFGAGLYVGWVASVSII